MLNIYDQPPLSIVCMESKFDNLLFLIYIGNTQAHVGQEVNKLGNTETISHALLLLCQRTVGWKGYGAPVENAFIGRQFVSVYHIHAILAFLPELVLNQVHVRCFLRLLQLLYVA